MVVFGGHDGVNYLNDVHKLDLTTNTWSGAITTSGVPSVRGYHTSVVYGDFMVVFGGYDGGFLNDVHKLTLTPGPRGLHGTNGTDGAEGPQGPIGVQGPPGENGTCSDSNATILALIQSKLTGTNASGGGPTGP